MPPTNTKATSVARLAAERFATLVEIMQALRAPDGCPWDRKQTLASLRPFVLEETYEVLEAIDRGDLDALRGELGDYLFEAVFLAQIAADKGRFTIADALDAINAKLVRRHPHVFGDAAADAAMHAPPPPGLADRRRKKPFSRRTIATAGKVLEQWEQIKAREQRHAGTTPSILAGVPKALPSLLRAHEISSRAAAVGFDWPTPADVVLKIEEEVRELREAVKSRDRRHAAEEMGDLLFSIANLARKLDIEPESALREANEKFTARFQAVEETFADAGRQLSDATLEEMEKTWQTVKRQKAEGRRQKADVSAKPGRRGSPSASVSPSRKPGRPRSPRRTR